MNNSIKFLLVVAIVLNSCTSFFNCETWLNKEISPIDIYGIIEEKKDNSSCEGKIIIRSYHNKLDSLIICNCGLSKEFWNYINEGDSIIKSKGSVKLIVLKNANDSISVKQFSYPCCDH